MEFNTSLANVAKVYSGKPGCMCGCQGKYSEAGVNDRSVKIIYNKVMKHPDMKVDDNFAYAYVDTGTRNLVVYFKG